jgi:hypothetical protein
VVRLNSIRNNRTLIAVLSASLIGIGLISSSVFLAAAIPPTVKLPGQDVSETIFADLVNATPSAQAYPADYTIVSKKPYIVNIDYSDSYLITDYAAKQKAWSFIESVLPPDVVVQLQVEDRMSDLFGILPRWSISFRNASIDTPVRIVAIVLVNALSGEVIGYRGMNLYPQDPVTNQSSAETIAASFIQYVNLSIQPHSRYMVSTDSSRTTSRNTDYYRFEFQEALGPVLIQADIGSLTVEVDMSDGGIYYFSYIWIPFEEIDVTGVVDPILQGSASKSLLLALLYDQDEYIANLGEITARLCWRVDSFQSSGYETSFLDAFSGEVVGTLDYFGQPSSTMTGIATVPCALAISLLAYIVGRRKLRSFI